ncbi:MAG: AMP nucleosidase, partial [Geminicoccaceae bacterium]
MDALVELFASLGIREPKALTTPDDVVAEVSALYERSTQAIRTTFRDFEAGGEPPAPADATYPFLGLRVPPERLNIDARLAFGALTDPGVFGTTVTRPGLFVGYLRDNVQRLMNHHEVPMVVGRSNRLIPLPFVVDRSGLELAGERTADLMRRFVLPDLRYTDDRVANGFYREPSEAIQPLSLFTAERTDYSLQRLYHYTGSDPEYFQRFVLLTNYQRYVDRFVEHGKKLVFESDEFEALVEPGNAITAPPHFEPDGPSGTPPAHLPQMPAYHLFRKDRRGITMINIGVGPSNARTITDHLAVLRPHCWLMLGHCAGLRRSQQLGDYVLAHGYVRDDHVLDQELPLFVPVPPIAEVQVALQEAVAKVTGLRGLDLKTRMRTGTVATTDNRNWELRYAELYERLNQSRAIAVDMESATIAANGFRFRVPYGTLLCVSDKPLHGELKLRGMANAFYQQRVAQHLEIGIQAMRTLREGGTDVLHSRKLRSFDEPA